MAEEKDLVAIAFKADKSREFLVNKLAGLAEVNDFPVPADALRVGTLDSLMSLSDDISKMDALAEGTCFKLFRQHEDLKGGIAPSVMGTDVMTYATKQWDWDEAKFQLKTPLRELAEMISGKIGGLEEELKAKVAELNALKGSLQAFERRGQGNLMVRGLGDIVQEDDILDSEYMTTVMVVIQKSSMKEFLLEYERLADYVVPLSAKAISEDSEYVLFGVTLFKKCLDQFKTSCREKRFTVREFEFNAEALAADDAKKAEDEAECSRQTAMLSNWCAINYAEGLTMMMHLKATEISRDQPRPAEISRDRPRSKGAAPATASGAECTARHHPRAPSPLRPITHCRRIGPLPALAAAVRVLAPPVAPAVCACLDAVSR